MKAQKAKMKRNESQKTKKLQNAAGLGADNICLNFSRIRAVFGNLCGGPHVAAQASQRWKEMKAQKAKMKGHEVLKGQNASKRRSEKVQMEGNEGPKDQNERKWKPTKPKQI